MHACSLYLLVVLIIFKLVRSQISSEPIIKQIGRLYIPNVGPGACENVAIDADNERLFAANGYSVGLTVIKYSANNINTDNLSFDMSLETIIDLSNVGINENVTISDITSLYMSVQGYLVTLAVPINFAVDEGYLVFINTTTLEIIYSTLLIDCWLPDHIITTHDGNKLFISCEGEPNEEIEYPLYNPEGHVIIVDVSNGIENPDNIIQTNINFNEYNFLFEYTDYDHNGNFEYNNGIYRLFEDKSFSINVEPEYTAISEDDSYAFISLQEANTIAIIDINTNTLIDIKGLGFINYETESKLDASDRDNKINIKNYPNLMGLKQPDSLKYVYKNNNHYVISSNEGDSKDWDEIKVEDITLNKTSFSNSNITELQEKENLGRLVVSSKIGYNYSNNTKIFNTLYAYSSRNFDIWLYNENDNTFTSVYNSADDFETITAELLGDTGFNTDDDNQPSFDSRSDKKGPEPEALEYIKCISTDNEYVFIGMERTGGIFVYDLTNVDFINNKPIFLQYETNRNFSVVFDDDSRPPENAGDIAPEHFLAFNDLKYGTELLITVNTQSSSVTMYSIDCLYGVNLDDYGSNDDSSVIYGNIRYLFFVGLIFVLIV